MRARTLCYDERMGRAEWAVSEVPALGRDLGARAGGQSVALLVGGILGSVLLVPATVALVHTVLHPETPRVVGALELADRRGVPDGSVIESELRMDPSSALELQGPEDDPDVLVALAEPADVVVLGRASDPELRPVLELLRRAAAADPDAVANRELEWPARRLRGRIHDVDESGEGFWKLAPEDVLGFTRGHLVLDPPPAIRVLDLEDSTEWGGPDSMLAWALWAWALLAVAAFWGALFWTRRRARAGVEGVTPADLLARDPGLVTVLCFFTLGVYQIYWNWVATRALRRIAGRPDLLPGIDLVLSVLTLGVWGVYVHVRNAAIVDALLQPLRVSNVRWQVLGLYLASIFCSLTVFGALYRLAEGYREVTFLELRGELGSRSAGAAP